VNARGVRNRLKIATNEIRKAVQLQGEPAVRLLAIAAGSAQAEIGVIRELNRTGIRVDCVMVDIAQSACDYAGDLAKTAGVTDQFRTFRAALGSKAYRALLREFRPHVVEMFGLLDYLPTDLAIRHISVIRDSLPSGGYFLTCNICPNPEQSFLKHIVNWDMIYRDGTQLEALVKAADFPGPSVRIIHEPLRVHALAICRKD
jgi:hypothetical protein